jgi:sugar O-acyltransferase (sialic acid O-acetyltransferase NeuD family)
MRIAICGTGGLAREIAPLALAQVRAAGSTAPDPVVFVPADPGDLSPVAGLPARALDQLEADYALIVAVGDGGLRRRIAETAGEGRGFATVIADTARLRGRQTISAGAMLCDGVVVTDEVVIGRHFLANPRALVMHDCRIGDFVTLGPAAVINGNVEIGDDVWIGAGAVVKNGRPGAPLRIGQGAVVGMGAVVIRDVAPGETVVGNPARPLQG